MKKILIILLILISYSSFAYDKIENTYVINNTNEDIEVYYQRCSWEQGCQKIEKLFICSYENGDHVGKVPFSNFYDRLNIVKVKSSTKLVKFASLHENVQLQQHGKYTYDDIMTCAIYNPSYREHFFIESIIENQITCRAKALFS